MFTTLGTKHKLHVVFKFEAQSRAESEAVAALQRRLAMIQHLVQAYSTEALYADKLESEGNAEHAANEKLRQIQTAAQRQQALIWYLVMVSRLMPLSSEA